MRAGRLRLRGERLTRSDAMFILSIANARARRYIPLMTTSNTVRTIWFKRERTLRLRARDATSPRMQAFYMQKASKVRATELADLRLAYQTERVNEIAAARRFELSRIVPGIVWLSCHGGAS